MNTEIERRMQLDIDRLSAAWEQERNVVDAKANEIEDYLRQLDERDAHTADQHSEILRLTAALAKANSQTEEFERKWYLAKDERDRYATISITALNERDAALVELGYIANAKRFDREKFDDDTSFADWAQSRARAAITKERK